MGNGIFSRLFGMGRVSKPPATRLAAPASVQRSHLGIRHVDLDAGMVRHRSGTLVAALAVTGMPLAHRSDQEAHAFLVRLAAAINAMPAESVWLCRSREGLRAAYLRERRDQAALVAQRAPGTALAHLAADQLAALRVDSAAGRYRQTDPYVLVLSAKGNVAELRQRIAAATSHLAAVGVAPKLVRHRALAEALCLSWQPEMREFIEVVAGDERVRISRSHVTKPYRVGASGRNGTAPSRNGHAHLQVVR